MAVVVDAGHRFDDRRVRGPVAIRRCDRVPESRDRDVDRARVPLGDRGVAEPHAIHRAGFEVLGDHVELFGEREEEVAVLLVLSGRDRRCACRSCCAGTWRRPCGLPGRASRASRRGPIRRARGVRPSPRRRQAGRGAASRTAAPASARPPARAPRRAACRTRPHLRWQCRRVASPSQYGALRPLGDCESASRRLPSMRGIISVGGYVPYWRLQRNEISKTFGSGGGKGTRSVASYDQDTTTLGVEAARLALRGAPSPRRAVVRDRRARVSRQEQRLDRPRRVAPRFRRARVRLRRRAALGHRRAADRACRQRIRPRRVVGSAHRLADEWRRISNR